MTGPADASLWVAIVPLIAILPAILCMIDIVRHPNTRGLTPQAWLAMCAFGNLFGSEVRPERKTLVPHQASFVPVATLSRSTLVVT
ncbi:hypothetical protein [Streptomyces sp. NPDC057403]|uniref:hypothetical protein n=1 Tax=Streptomyces sp. NPDC057403 TaxID=3346119 RepID=UPI00369A2123